MFSSKIKKAIPVIDPIRKDLNYINVSVVFSPADLWFFHDYPPILFPFQKVPKGAYSQTIQQWHSWDTLVSHIWCPTMSRPSQPHQSLSRDQHSLAVKTTAQTLISQMFTRARNQVRQHACNTLEDTWDTFFS